MTGVCTNLCTRLPGTGVNAETTRLVRDKPHRVYPGELRFERPGETPETCLALLITQRSEVQILPPLLRSEAFG